MIVESAEKQKRWADLAQSVARSNGRFIVKKSDEGIWPDFVNSQMPHLEALLSESSDLLDFFESMAIGLDEWLDENPENEDGDFEIPFDDPTQRTGRHF